VFQKHGCQPVVVVPLLDRVVLGRIGEVFLPLDNQELFQFRIGLPRKLFAGVALSLLLLWGGLLLGSWAVDWLRLLACLSSRGSRLCYHRRHTLRWPFVGAGRNPGNCGDFGRLLLLVGVEQQGWEFHGKRTLSIHARVPDHSVVVVVAAAAT